MEHEGNFDQLVEKIAEVGDKGTYFYFEVPFDSPFYGSFFDNMHYLTNKYFTLGKIVNQYIKGIRDKKRGMFKPMHEHVNYFTEASLKQLIMNHDIEVIKCYTHLSEEVIKSKAIGVLGVKK